MNPFDAKIVFSADFEAVLIRADGTHCEVSHQSRNLDPLICAKKLVAPQAWWKRLYQQMRGSNLIPAAMGLAAFIQWVKSGDASGVQMALVTTAGINLLAADFLTSASTHISAFNFHDSGTGTTAAAIGDTTLVTQAGPTTRATGTQSTPVAGQYRSVGTISYTSTLAITEWGLFSQAAQGGTLWDRRVFSAINVVSGDSIQITYTLTTTAGGS